MTKALRKTIMKMSELGSKYVANGTNGIRTIARLDNSPADTSPKKHPRQTVARWTLTQKTVIRPDSNPTEQ